MILFAIITTSIYAQSFSRYDASECIGIYSPSTLVPGQESFLHATLAPTSDEGSAAVAIFHFKDRNNIETMSSFADYLICSQLDVEASVCLPAEVGKFHLRDRSGQWPIVNEKLTWAGGKAAVTEQNLNVSVSNGLFNVKYSVAETGFYCVFLGSERSEGHKDFEARFLVNNSYGKLPAIYYPALPFFLCLSVLYSSYAVIWISVSAKHWQSLLPIQNYVSGVIGFLIVEMAFNYEFFNSYNVHGVVNHTLLAFTVILNAARNSISFFMMLIVCLGYGVVKHTLGDRMKVVLMLTLAHFLCNVLYATNSMLASDVNANMVFLTALPLSITMSVFYTWTISALSDTISHLEKRRQAVKLLMYTRLRMIITFSLVTVFLIFIANAFNLAHKREEAWIENQWKYRWMLLDGALNILYLVTFTLIAFLWMPCENNERYGLDQVPEEDDEALPVGIELEDGVKMRTKSKGSTGNGSDTEDDEKVLEWAEQNDWGEFGDDEE